MYFCMHALMAGTNNNITPPLYICQQQACNDRLVCAHSTENLYFLMHEQFLMNILNSMVTVFQLHWLHQFMSNTFFFRQHMVRLYRGDTSWYTCGPPQMVRLLYCCIFCSTLQGMRHHFAKKQYPPSEHHASHF